MSWPREFLQTPLGIAVRGTVFMALFGVVIRTVWGSFDPDMRKWTFVMISPLLGGVLYLHASGRALALAWLYIALGVAALAFWAFAINSGGLPVTDPGEWILVAMIVAIPVFVALMGLLTLRRARAAAASEGPPARTP
jgi:hypothetical protein